MTILGGPAKLLFKEEPLMANKKFEEELKRLGDQILALRKSGRNLYLSDEMKRHICQLCESGVNRYQIQKATGIQGISIRRWQKTLSLERPLPERRQFQVLKVSAASLEAADLMPPPALTGPIEPSVLFRYSRGNFSIKLRIPELVADVKRALAW